MNKLLEHQEVLGTPYPPPWGSRLQEFIGIPGAYVDLKELHRNLDEAVIACYGWDRAIAQDDQALVRKLTELNRQVANGEREYKPFEVPLNKSS